MGYQERIAAAGSFKDIVSTFELLFPGATADQMKFAEIRDKALSNWAVMQNPDANPEEQYLAMKQFGAAPSWVMSRVLDWNGIDKTEAVTKIGELKALLPGKMLDGYVATAREIAAQLATVDVTEKLRVITANEGRVSKIKEDVRAKYATVLDAINSEIESIRDASRQWQAEWGNGSWRWANEEVGKAYRPWTPESIAQFEQDFNSKVDDLKQELAEPRERKQKVLDAVWEESAAATKDIDEDLARQKQELGDAKDKAYTAVINAVLAKSPVSEEMASAWAKENAIFDAAAMRKSAKTGYNKKDIERDVQLFYRLTGGRLPRLEFATTRKSRSAAAHWTGELFVGHGFGRRTLWHEMAHLLEDDEKVKVAAKAFLARRSEGPQTYRLSDLEPGTNYGASEVAYKDHWFDPYVGKDYNGVATEVVSMGMQQLSSIDRMFELQGKDPEHLAFMLGLCASPPVIDNDAMTQKQAETKVKIAEGNKRESFFKELDKEISKAGDFWSVDGFEISEEERYDYRYRKNVMRTEVKYAKEYDPDGTLRRYKSVPSSYIKGVKAAKRVLYLWYQGGKQQGGDLDLINIAYQLDKKKEKIPGYIMQVPLEHLGQA